MWKDIPNYNIRYEINENGDIRNKKTMRILKHSINEKGYHKVSIYSNDNKVHKIGVHKLVALAFIENPNNYIEINHIDENKDNNNYKNLEWCSRQQNIEHSIKSGKFKICPIIQYDTKGNKIAEYNSCSEAERKTGIKRTHICKCTLNRYGFKTAGGYVWRKIK